MFRKNFFYVILCLAIAGAIMAIPSEMQYQGKLTNISGVGTNDTLPMVFRIFNAPSGGSALWTETWSGINEVPVVKGLFDVRLGKINPINLPFDVQYWLEIEVNGSILSPRIKLTVSPYAFRAGVADSVATSPQAFKRLRAGGGPWLLDSVTIVAGTGINITQLGDSITISATGGGGVSLWTDHPTDPYIYANNNANVQVWDNTSDSFLTVINHSGTAIKAVGMDFPYPQYGYLGYGGECPGHPYGWSAAGVLGYTTSYVDAVYGYAEYGGYGVLGVSGYDDDYFGGVGGYNTESENWGKLGTYYYGGEFTGGIYIEPNTTPPLAIKGAIYANNTDNKLYFHNGTSWIDLTATGGTGGGEWEDAGIYKRVIGNDNVRAYELGQNKGYFTRLPYTTTGNYHAYDGIVTGSNASTCFAESLYAGVYSGGGMGGTFYGSYAEAEWGANNYGVYGIGRSAVANTYGVYGEAINISSFSPNIYGVYGKASGTSGTKYGVYGIATGVGTNYAGYFEGDVRITGKYLDSSGDAGTAGQILSSTGTGTDWITGGGGGGVGGSGTLNYIPLWTPDGATLGNSRAQQNANTVFISGTSGRQAQFNVYCDQTSDLHGAVVSNLYGSTANGTSWNFLTSGGSGIMGINETAGQYKAGLHGIVWDAFNANIAGVVGSNQINSTFGALSFYDGANWFAGYFSGDVRVTGKYLDSSGDAGAARQILSTTGTGTNWVDLIDITGCPHKILLFDSYGDGWHGNNFCDVLVNGVLVLDDITLASGFGPAIFTFNARTGDAIQVTFTPGSWPGECYYDVLDGSGALLVDDWYPNVSGTWNGVASCVGVPFGGEPNHWTISGSNLYPVNPVNNVGIGTTTPTKRLHVSDPSQPTQAIFGEEQPVSIIRWSPMIGFNAIWDHSIFGYAYYSSAHAGLINFNQELAGGFNILTAPSGTGGTAATMTSRLAITNAGNVGIGTTTPAQKLDVVGNVKVERNAYCITLTAGENIAQGEIVSVSTTADFQVVKAPIGSETVVGVAVAAATAGSSVTIAVSGAVQVLTNAAVTRGNFVRCGGAAGQAINSGTTGQAGDFGIFIQTTAGPGLAWMVFKTAEIY